VLLRRIAFEVDPELFVQVLRPIRQPRGSLVKLGVLERSVELAASRLEGKGGILVLIDADEDCPAKLGPDLLDRCVRARSDVQAAVVLAKREFEAWFLASAESFRGQYGLPGNLNAPDDPEGVQGAKGWISGRMPRGSPYSPTRHQAAFCHRLDTARARERSASFDKLYRDVARLICETAAIV
jgi:hypothetical protein